MPLAELREASGVANAARILQRNVYGWFVRVGRGVYGLSAGGARRSEPSPMRWRRLPAGRSPARQPDAGTADDAELRRLIAEYFGPGSRLRILRPAPAFGASVFVVDFDRGPRHYRTLGSFGPSFGAADPHVPQVTEQSSMDLLYPAHLVFHYERLMSLAFALCERPVSALLLGIGGAAMWRFMRAYVSECAPTLVDADQSRNGDREALVLSEPAGRHRNGAALSGRQ